MIKNYSSYQTESTDGQGHIFTSVLVDGSATCEQTLECPCNSATHKPEALNQLGSVGGWGSGSAQCVSCYLSYQNNQSISASNGPEFLFQSATQVVCSIVGVFYAAEWPFGYISLAYTKEKTTVDDQRGHCYSVPICSNTTTPRCVISPINEFGDPCHPAHNCESLAWRLTNYAPWEYFVNVCPGTYDTTPSNSCTPQ
jgi:hypothetical protein